MFRVEKPQTARIKWMLSLSSAIKPTQWVMWGIPDFGQYCEQFPSVLTIEP
jgi:hypothetical protein